MKPKENKGNRVGTYDNCQTPPYALEPLIPFINKNHQVWECAAGREVLTRELRRRGFDVLSTGKGAIVPHEDFFSIVPGVLNYTIVTNPPYSIKYFWLDRCFELGKPFALLLPVEALGAKKAQKYIDRLEVILLQPRVDFYMPDMGYEGGGAQFPTAWFTKGLNLSSQLTVGYLNKPKRNELKEYWRKALNE